MELQEETDKQAPRNGEKVEEKKNKKEEEAEEVKEDD